MPRIALVTGGTPGFLGVEGEAFRVSVERYAQHHGFAYHWHGDFDPTRPPAWSKVRFLQQHRENFDWLLWVDADVYAMPNAATVAHFLDTEKPVVIAEDCNGLNSGVFALRCGEWATGFLDDIWGRTHYLHHPWWENAAIHDRHREEPQAFHLVPKTIWNAYPDDVGPASVFLHFPGGWKPEVRRFLTPPTCPDSASEIRGPNRFDNPPSFS